VIARVCVGFGLLNKVALHFDRDKVFWDPATDVIGLLSDGGPTSRGSAFQVISLLRACQQPTLLALVAGDAAALQERQSDASITEGVLARLRRVYGVATVPEPLHTQVGVCDELAAARAALGGAWWMSRCLLPSPGPELGIRTYTSCTDRQHWGHCGACGGTVHAGDALGC
jgi:hypothetical protein